MTKSAIKEKYMNVVQKLAILRAEIGQLNEEYSESVKVSLHLSLGQRCANFNAVRASNS